MVSPRPSLELHSFSCKFACWVVWVFVLVNSKASQVTPRTEEKIEVICRHKAFLRAWLEFTDNKDELGSYRFLFLSVSWASCRKMNAFTPFGQLWISHYICLFIGSLLSHRTYYMQVGCLSNALVRKEIMGEVNAQIAQWPRWLRQSLMLAILCWSCAATFQPWKTSA